MTNTEKVRNYIGTCLYAAGCLESQIDKYVTQILSHPSIRIVAEDQGLPDKLKNHNWYDDDYGKAGEIGYDLALDDVINAGWVKCEEK